MKARVALRVSAKNLPLASNKRCVALFFLSYGANTTWAKFSLREKHVPTVLIKVLARKKRFKHEPKIKNLTAMYLTGNYCDSDNVSPAPGNI